MKETTPAAMPPCFDKWCKRFDDLLLTKAQKREFRHYLGGLAKNRKVKVVNCPELTFTIRLDVLAESLPEEAFTRTTISLEKPRTVWVAIIEVEISRLEGTRKIAIVMNAPTFRDADEFDYFITNVEPSIVTPQWIVDTYSQRNWVEVFYREAKGWLGLKEYQVRSRSSLTRHFTLVFCAYTFILWHKLTGGLRRRWANKPITTFPEAMARISYGYILSFCPMA